jgi:hypothetical protein
MGRYARRVGTGGTDDKADLLSEPGPSRVEVGTLLATHSAISCARERFLAQEKRMTFSDQAVMGRTHS